MQFPQAGKTLKPKMIGLGVLALFLVLVVSDLYRQLSAPPSATMQASARALADKVAETLPGAPPAVSTYADPGTGCEYLVARGAGITPRLGPDGRQRCAALSAPAPAAPAAKTVRKPGAGS